MLSFLRKHQKYFFAVITFVIVLSFSFFGTYNTLPGNSIHEETAFTTVTGDAVSRGELEEMVNFISTDTYDHLLFGGHFGPNFLNDGVIQKDFLETGLAEILIENYKDALKDDLSTRFTKEKSYKPYVHPEGKFISSIAAWSYFAPAIVENLKTLQNSSDPLDKQALNAKIQLFLAEKSFSAPYLRGALSYQEKQYNWLKHDKALDSYDFFLFGYQTTSDWFGPKFNRLIAEFIFNAAGIAEQKGYVVSKEEALYDLLKNAETSFKANKTNPALTASTPESYFEEQLFRMRLDKSKAAKIWQKVLLYRRLFNDISSAMFVDIKPYEEFNKLANQTLLGVVYELPKSLTITDSKTFAKLDSYLDLIAKRTKEEKSSNKIPDKFLTVEEVNAKAPYLVRKPYTLEIKTINKSSLETKVTSKETLNFQISEEGFALLQKQIPELALNTPATKQLRLEAIDKLDSTTRQRADQLARKEIVNNHPEWIDQALSLKKGEEQKVLLTTKGKNAPFKGLEKGDELILLLDKSELNKDDPALKRLTFDNENFYSVVVLEKGNKPYVLTFEEANNNALLDSFVTENKPLTSGENEGLLPSKFLQSGKDLLAKIKSSPNETLTKTEQEPINYQNQFKWIKSPLKITRKEDSSLAEVKTLFSLIPGSFSEVISSPSGALYFAKVEKIEKEVASSDPLLKTQVERARFLLGTGAERAYLNSLIPLLKEKKAISIDLPSTPGEEEIQPKS